MFVRGARGFRAVPPPPPIANPQTRGIHSIVVYLKSSKSLPETVRKSIRTPDKPAVMRFIDGRFSPRMVALQTGQRLEFRHRDKVPHFLLPYTIYNLPGPVLRRARQDGSGDVVFNYSFKLPERLPSRITCVNHVGEHAHWVILDHPYHLSLIHI